MSESSGSSTKNRLYHESVSDDGAGGWLPLDGGVDYTSGDFSLGVYPITREYTWTKSGWTGSSSSQSDSLKLAGDTLTVRYTPAGATAESVSTEISIPPLTIRILPRLLDVLTVPNSVEFTWNGKTYLDRNGIIYTDVQPNGSGTPAGSIDYLSGIVTLDYYAAGSGAPAVTSLLGVYGDWDTDEAFFRTTAAPLAPQSLQVVATTLDGTQITATADQDGVIDSAEMQGAVDYQFGTARIEFGSLIADASLTPEDRLEDWYDPANVDAEGNVWKPLQVMPSTLIYNAVAFRYIPLDAAILGLDAVRLPADGRVPFIRPGDVAVIHHTDTTDLGDGSTVTDLGHTRLSFAHVYDASGTRLPSADITADLDAGTVSVPDPTGYDTPLTCEWRIEDMRLVTEVDISGRITLANAVTRDFPAEKTYLSTALLYGDLAASASVAFGQRTWTNEWKDSLIGDASSATYNDTDYPLGITNEGTIQERWRLEFTSTSTVNVIGEYTGQILTNASINDPIAPANPTTPNATPYFVLEPAGWGGGWATGNVLRFNTRASNRPVWIARTTLASDERTESDAFQIQTRGDSN